MGWERFSNGDYPEECYQSKPRMRYNSGEVKTVSDVIFFASRGNPVMKMAGRVENEAVESCGGGLGKFGRWSEGNFTEDPLSNQKIGLV